MAAALGGADFGFVTPVRYEKFGHSPLLLFTNFGAGTWPAPKRYAYIRRGQAAVTELAAELGFPVFSTDACARRVLSPVAWQSPALFGKAAWLAQRS